MHREIKKIIWIPLAFLISCGNDNQNKQKPGIITTSKIISESLKKPEPETMMQVPVQSPRIEENKGKCTLILPEQITKVLSVYDPNFKTWKTSDFVRSIEGNRHYYKCSEKQLHYAVLGEFNGDSITDVILMGRNKKHSLILGIISQGLTYRVIQIKKRELINPKNTWIDNENNTGLWGYIYHCSPVEPSTKKKFGFKFDAFLYGTYGKGSGIYWYEKGKFKNAGFSD